MLSWRKIRRPSKPWRVISARVLRWRSANSARVKCKAISLSSTILVGHEITRRVADLFGALARDDRAFADRHGQARTVVQQHHLLEEQHAGLEHRGVAR